MKRFVLPLIGLAIIVVAVASYLAFPGWWDAEGGLLALLGVVTLGVLAAAKDMVSIGKDLGWWGQEEAGSGKPAGSDTPGGGVHVGRDLQADDGAVVAGGEVRAGEGGVVTGKIEHAEQVGGRREVHHHHYAHESKQIEGKPLELPPRAAHFTGREDDIAQLAADLAPGKVVTVTGPGGMGKTALTGAALWRMTAGGTRTPERFPDGVIFFSFYGRPDVNLAFAHIVQAYGEELKPSPADAARRALGGRQALVILDGAEEAEDLQAVLDVRGGCGVLVTTRQGGTGRALDALPEDDSMALLQAWGQDCVDDEGAARQICELVGGLPLAVRLAGKYLAENRERASEYLAWLSETPLQALVQGERRQESVAVLLRKSLE